MKLKLVAVAVTSMLAAGVVNAAEVLTKTVTNWICTAKLLVCTIFLMMLVATATKRMFVWASKVKLRSTIS